MFNSFVTHLDENKVLYYCPIIRLFNFLNARPFHLAWCLAHKKESLLGFLCDLRDKLGTEFLLKANMQELENRISDMLNSHLNISVNIKAERVAS